MTKPNRIKPHTRRHLLAWICFSSFLTQNGSLPEALAEPLLSTSPIEVYLHGQPAAAISALRGQLTRITATEDSLVAILFLRNLADLCSTANDRDCLNDILKHVGTLSQEVASSDEASTLFYLNRGYVLAVLALVSRDRGRMASVFEYGLLGMRENLLADPLLYIRRHFLAARLHLELGDPEKAEHTFDKGMVALASLQNPGSRAFEFAEFLTTAVSLYLRMDRTSDAEGLAGIAAEFLVSMLPPTSIHYARFRAMEAELHFSLGRTINAARSAERSLQVLANQDLPSWNFTDVRVGLESLLAAECALIAADPDCVDAALARLRSERQHYGPWERGQPPDHFEAYVTAIEVLATGLAGAGTRKPGLWHSEMTRTLTADWSFVPDPELDAARSVALSMLASWRGDGEILGPSRQALQRLRNVRTAAAGTGPGSMYLTTFANKLVLMVGTTVLTSGRTATGDDADLVLQAIETYTRDSRFRHSDLLADIGGASDFASRAIAHTLIRIRSKELYQQRTNISRQIASIQDSSFAEGALQVSMDWTTHRALAETALRRARLQHQLVTHPSYEAVPMQPTVSDVQAELGEGEALLFFGPAIGGHVISVCITSDKASAISYLVDGDELLRDTASLHSALTATHARSARKDSTYPVDAARRLYDVLLGPRVLGRETCIGPGMTVYLAPASYFDQVPIEATLIGRPEEDQVGWLLGSARWAFTRNDFVYVPSVRGFLAHRRMQRVARTHTPEVLAVGDPHVDGITADGVPALAAVTRRSSGHLSPGALGALGRLPNTAQEAESVFRATGESGRLIVGAEATEARIRADLLSRYRYIHLATHGLIREGETGLTEAALVLTPGSSVNPFDDGLLTASEIADLTLNADIAVLSACNTANFDTSYFHSELQGLAAAFAAAGVPSVLATLWAIETESSEELVTSFFRHFSRGAVTAAGSLSTARKDMLRSSDRTRHHPRNWAGFVLLGNTASSEDMDATPIPPLILAGNGRISSIAPVPAKNSFVAIRHGLDDGNTGTGLLSFDSTLDAIDQQELDGVQRVASGTADSVIVFRTKSASGDRLPMQAIQMLTLGDDSWHWQPNYMHSGPDHTVAANMIIQDRIASLTAQVVNRSDNLEADAMVQLSVVVVDENGLEIATQVLPFNLDASGIGPGGLAASEHELVVFVADPPGTLGDATFELTDFTTVEICPKPRDTHVAWLAPDGKEVRGRLTIENTVIHDIAAASNGRVFMVGQRMATCGLDRDLVIGEIVTSSATWNPLQLEPATGNTLGAQLAFAGEEQLLVAVTRQRQLGGELAQTERHSSPSQLTSTLATRERTTEAQILCIAFNGTVHAVTPLTAGTDLYVDAIAVADRSVVLGGQLGVQPFLYSMPLPCPDSN